MSRRRIGWFKTKKKFKATTYSKHNKPVADNILNRKITVEQPNKIWVGDITYIWRAEGGLYLATVIDLYFRRMVGWSMSNRMTVDLVNDAWLLAI